MPGDELGVVLIPTQDVIVGGLVGTEPMHSMVEALLCIDLQDVKVGNYSSLKV